jgi:succinate dehydrogenase flavin-adding protein (antitoxin of CptAB toxin-antitoxin module)
MEILDNISKELTEEQINALYLFIDMNLEGMSDEEKKMWTDILEKIDTDKYED